MRLVGGVLLLTISGLLLLMPILLNFGMAAAVLVALSAIWAVLMVIAGRLGATRRSLPLPARSETEDTSSTWTMGESPPSRNAD